MGKIKTKMLVLTENLSPLLPAPCPPASSPTPLSWRQNDTIKRVAKLNYEIPPISFLNDWIGLLSFLS